MAAEKTVQAVISSKPNTTLNLDDQRVQVIGIAATFTAQPVEEFLRFWMHELDLTGDIEFAPFNQIFQQLLDPSSTLSGDRNSVSVLLLRLEDLSDLTDAAPNSPFGTRAELVRELAEGVEALVQRTGTPVLAHLCPPSSTTLNDAGRNWALQVLEDRLASRLGEIAGVHVVTSAELTAGFSEHSYYAPGADAQGSVPYTPRFFAALGTRLARQITALRRPPRKVIVVDADDTLWKGVCGEDGWPGLEIDEPRRALQAFLIRQQEAGMLVCVCSKNNPADVASVFDHHPGMLLRREHITDWRVNWQEKSENIRSLANALGLGTDSFMFVDDSPLERAEVEANCPEVLTLRLPPEPELLSPFLENFWAFDRLKVTEEDRRRTELYRQNAQREELRAGSSGLHTFLEGLQLEVDVAPMQPRQAGRVSQLMQRTTQFNVRPVAYSEAEVLALLGAAGTDVLSVDVRDRFGQYGLVGVLVITTSAEALHLDTFLLSCRALGRGVEHRMLAAVGRLAKERGIAYVEVRLVETRRNAPAREFLDRVAGQYRRPATDHVLFRLPADVAAAVALDAWLDNSAATLAPAKQDVPETWAVNRQLDPDWVARLHRVATTLNDNDKILAAVEAERQRARPVALPAAEAPRTLTEQRLSRLWTQVLGVSEPGVEDDFFDLGGHSLLAMELISRVGDEFGVELPLRSVFERPTVAGLAAAISARTDRLGLETQPVEALSVVPARPDQQGEPFPLTEIQQAYWIGRTAGFELGNVAAHYYVEVDYAELNVARLNSVWQRLIQRHAMLRAIVRSDGRQQVLEQVPPFEVEVVDLREAPAAAAQAELDRLRGALSHEVRPSDTWPLFDIRAARLDGARVRVFYSFDLLIADAFSLLLLSREAAELYANPTMSLQPLSLSFRDYVLNEPRLGSEEEHQRSRDYWQERLPKLPPAPELPLVKLPAAVERPWFVRYATRLDPPRWARLKSHAAHLGLTPTTVVLRAFADVLALWSKHPHFSLNLTVMNRLPVHAQVSQLVGEFTSLELLAIDGTANGGSFLARAASLQQQLWEDLDHRRRGGVQLMRDMARDLDAHARALLPVVFTSTLSLGGDQDDTLPFVGTGVPVFGLTQTPQVWLDCGAFQHAGSLIVNWDAVEELFPPELLTDMSRAFEALLGQLADDELVWQTARPAALPVEQRRQREDVNATDGPVPSGLLHAPFLTQARRQPHAPAVVDATRTLSYDEVEQRSAHLAVELRQLGARPNELVAVVMEKGWEQVVATLGILRSGAAYLPLDPDLPAERLLYLLGHAEVSLAVTQPRVDDRLAWPAGLQRLRVESNAPMGATEPLEAVQTPEDLAYVIFTSGSTGVPKGVMIDHRAALNTLVDLNERFGVGPEDRVFALSSLSFDLSVYDIFGTLAAGGAIVMPDAAATRDPMHWSELLRRHRVTLWNSVPALMQMLVEFATDRPGSFPESLRLIWLSGDWIPVALPDRIRTLHGGVQLVSMGGATEASIWSILHPINVVDSARRSIPYGKPLRNQTFHVLDDELEPRPVWAVGQLYIGGIGLAQGYWRDPIKTSAKFIVHPRTGERLYHTGDLGRYLPDGNIEFLGREDFQVKIQGFRVELGEIEAALAQHPAVRETVVIARDGATAVADKRLVAYVLANDGRTAHPSDLRQFLRDKLPAYMVPADCVVLSSFPLTPNGKIDRQALPAPDYARADLRETYVAPRDAVEAELAELWEHVLGVRPIGVTDDFFELGGHSLLAVTLFGEIATRYGRDLPLATLFRDPTIARLADVLRHNTLQASWSPLVPIQTQGSRPPFFCLHSAGGNVLEYYPLAKRLGPDQPFYAVQSHGLDGTPGGPTSLEDMAAEYLAAIRTVQATGPYYLGGFCLGGMLAFEAAQQLTAAGEEVAVVTMIENPTLDYGRPLPRTTPLQRLLHRARQRLELELDNFALLEPPARMAHAQQRARRLLTLSWIHIETAAHPLLTRAWPARPLSRARVLEGLTQAHSRALQEYQPRVYRGRVVLIRGSEQPWGIVRDPAMGWDRLIQDGLELYGIPGQHKNVLKEPRVRLLAERLRTCLETTAELRTRRTPELLTV